MLTRALRIPFDELRDTSLLVFVRVICVWINKVIFSCYKNMFQGMFRKRGRPPDPLPIGGYDQPSNEGSNQIPVHQLMEAPRQLSLPSVRELDQDAVML